MENNTYKTQDIYEASFIYSKNVKLIGLEPNGKYSYFVFGNNPLCKELSSAYWTQQAEGNIKSFVNSLKTLKDLVFSKRKLSYD